MSETALSQANNSFSFLQGIEAATLTTPLEEESGKLKRFANYHTGTLALAITPAMVEQCSVLRTLEITAELKRLASVVAQLQASFEIGGQIQAIVDPTLIAQELPYTEDLADFTDDMKERSTMVVEYIDSTPTIYGIPLWDRLPGERVDFYNVFKLYRDSRYFLVETGEYAIVNRTLAGLARQLNIPGAILSYISKLYSWKTRCALYDQFMETEMQKRRAQNEVLLRNDHLAVAQKLCTKAWDYLDKNFAKLNPKEALQALELGIKYSRISIGLLPDKPGATVAGNQTNFAIYNTTTNNTADQMLNVSAGISPTGQGAGSAVERQLQQDMKDENTILSVLHVLQASGAMKSAIHADLLESGDEGLDIITEVEEDEE
jgi:hypothetical protein